MTAAQNAADAQYSFDLTPEALTVTEAARRKIAELISETDDDIAAVRVYVAGGGCTGMSYGMTFAEDAEQTDAEMTDGNGFRLVVDPVALSFLKGAEVDYVDDGMNASVVFNNVFQAVGGSGACSGCGGGAF